MPLIWNPGGGGGISTVHTDGVTIQGDGSIATPIALLDAETDGVTIIGAGIAANKIRSNGAPVGFFNAVYDFGTLGPGGNGVIVCGFVLTAALTFSHLAANFTTPGGTDLVDLGVYTQAGTLVADIGPQNTNFTGIHSFAVLQAPVTLPIGLYMFGCACDGGFVKLASGNNGPMIWCQANLGAISAGGQLPSTVPAQTVTATNNGFGFALF